MDARKVSGDSYRVCSHLIVRVRLVSGYVYRGGPVAPVYAVGTLRAAHGDGYRLAGDGRAPGGDEVGFRRRVHNDDADRVGGGLVAVIDGEREGDDGVGIDRWCYDGGRQRRLVGELDIKIRVVAPPVGRRGAVSLRDRAVQGNRRALLHHPADASVGCRRAEGGSCHIYLQRAPVVAVLEDRVAGSGHGYSVGARIHASPVHVEGIAVNNGK